MKNMQPKSNPCKPRLAWFCGIVVLLIGTGQAHGLSDKAILEAMTTEMQRSVETLSQQEQPLYYLSYEVTETKVRSLSADRGKVVVNSENQSTLLNMDLRVGDAEFDNTHVLPSQTRRPFGSSQARRFPISLGNAGAIRQDLWYATDLEYRNQAAAYENLIQTEKLESAEREDIPDFAFSSPESAIEREQNLQWNEKKWKKRLEEASAVFKGHPTKMYTGNANLGATITNTYFVNSEGSAIKQSQALYNLSLLVVGQNDKGEMIQRYAWFAARSLAGLPSQKELIANANELKAQLLALLDAPIADPFTGPAILSGKANGVFFHEILGHRLEGHRLRQKSDAQTFKEKIDQQILPRSFSVHFDPTIESYDNQELIGDYRFDNEGVKGQRVTVIENGILKRFLMSRTPLAEFPHSNGHGRKQVGFKAISRQSNLIVEVSESVPLVQLKEMLLDEVAKQGKEYGLLVEDIQGGFTFTGRSMPNAFNVTPTIVYKIYLDGTEELVRGLDLIGTPLDAFSRIVAASNEMEIFNGFCGAESGSIPVSAIAPAVLVRQVETQKKALNETRLPILPPPIAAKTY